jgi:tetrahydromethanopterin S-methyltransferase subunit B
MPPDIFQQMDDLKSRIERLEKYSGPMSNEAWHVVGAAGEPAFLNSWTNYAGGYATAGFYKDSLGIVHLRGLVKSGTATTIFTLPVGYRPEYYVLFATSTDPNIYGRCDVLTTGAVVKSAGSTTWFSLDGLTFRAYQ